LNLSLKITIYPPPADFQSHGVLPSSFIGSVRITSNVNKEKEGAETCDPNEAIESIASVDLVPAIAYNRSRSKLISKT
jgi:hypothetical protein